MPEKSQITKESRLSEWMGILPLSSIVSIGIVIFLVHAFFSGSLYSFYASALFLFYGLTNSMWISVVMLGMFQTLVLAPLRVIRVVRSDNIKEFQQKIQAKGDRHAHLEKIQGKFSGGNRVFQFYLVDFMIQLATFLTIGRLFLTDFYSKRLDPRILYDFVPYPSYPIKDTMFKIPYLDVVETTDLGFKAILILWLALLVFQVVFWIGKSIYARFKKQKFAQKKIGPSKYTFAYMILLFALSALLMKNFPTELTVSIFSGDVSIPNRTLNTVTAIATFLTILWFGMQRIRVKGKKAKENDVPQDIIDATQKEMFRDSVFTATVVGLGAFYVTNQIPSAFELSIFTLEIIAFFSPFTLDKIILKSRQKVSG